MLHTVAEVSEKLNVSKQTIYTKLNILKKDLKGHLKIQNNTRYIDDEGIEIIKNSLQVNQINQDDSYTLNNNEIIKQLDEFKQFKNEYIKDLKDQIEYLKSEVETKNKLLESSNLQLNSKDKLLENFQVLMKNQQQIQTDNKKLLEWIACTREETEKKKSFFNKLFGK